MAKSRRSSVENMFSNKGSVQPQKKEASVEKADKTSSSAIMTEPTSEEPVPAPTLEEEMSKTPEKKTTKKTSLKSTSPNMDELFKKKKGKGTQRTIYLNKKVNDFCEEICGKYELGISEVINRLIESIIEEDWFWYSL